MIEEINDSKEVIKNRMLKNALNYWGVKNTEDLDPAVKLILEALSSELYNLGNEIKDTQVRILEKIANLLAPDYLTLPNPAHALLHAASLESTELISKTTGFFTQRKISSKQNEVLDKNLDIYFTPVDAVQVFDASISCMVTKGNFYSYDVAFNKQLTIRSRGKFTENNTLWLGLKINPKIENIQNLAFCFDWKNIESNLAHRLYQLLPLTKWYINDVEIEMVQGIQYNSNGNGGAENIFLQYDLLSLVEKDIKLFYDQRIVSVKNQNTNTLNDLKRSSPASFANYFTESELQKLSEKLLWIKIVFPAAMQQEFLDDAYIYLNTFPVLNRNLNDYKYRLRGGSNIIPLRTAEMEQFLSVKSLTDEKNQYKSVPYRKLEEEETGTYTLRKGGVERFDGRNANEFIGYLLELLRSESAAFSVYGYDFIASTLREMNQRIALMEQKTKGYINNTLEIPSYIIVKPIEGNDMMYAEYWTTIAEAANNLRAGTKLRQVKGVKVKQESLQLMTTTTGGKNRLKPEERLNAFRYGIMTRNRIVTKEDIRNFCVTELGESVSKIEVDKGIEMSANPKGGFRRTIDVKITPLETEAFDSEQWQLLCEQLKIKLLNRSGLSNNYRIILQK